MLRKLTSLTAASSPITIADREGKGRLDFGQKNVSDVINQCVIRTYPLIYSLVCNEYKIILVQREKKLERWFPHIVFLLNIDFVEPILVSLSAWLMLPTFFGCCVVKSISYKVESFIVQIILFCSRHFNKRFSYLQSTYYTWRVKNSLLCSRTIIMKKCGNSLMK